MSLCRSYGMTVDEAAHLKEVYRERYLPIGIYETTIYPGTKERLSSLKKQERSWLLQLLNLSKWQ